MKANLDARCVADELTGARFRPEAELLVRCAVARPRDEGRISDLVSRGLDWRFLLRAAERHRVLPLLCRNLERGCPDRVPATVMRQLRSGLVTNAARSMEMTCELLTVVKLLQASGIEVVPFKGPMLAVAAHGDLALRQFSDLDILVHPADIGAARAVLATRGYRDRESPHADDLAPSLRSTYHAKLLRQDRGIFLELHWAFAPDAFNFRFEEEPFWERLVVVRIGDAAVSCFAPEDSFLVLAVHGAKHQWWRLDWLSSTVEYLARNPDLDLFRTLALARKLHVERIVRLAIWFASDLYGVPVPGAIARQVRQDKVVARLGRRVLQRLFVEREPHPGEYHSFHLRLREHAADRWRYFTHIGVMPNARDRASLALPGFLAALRHLTRPLRLVSIYRWRSVKQMLGSLWCF